MSLATFIMLLFLPFLFYIASKLYKDQKLDYNINEWEELAHIAFYSLNVDNNGQVRSFYPDKLQEFVDAYIEVRSYDNSFKG